METRVPYLRWERVQNAKNGSNGARTHDLSRVRRTLIPAELCFQGGPEGIRTLDLCVANAALSQLSHEPMEIHKRCSMDYCITLAVKIK